MKLPEKLFYSFARAQDIYLYALLSTYAKRTGLVCLTYRELLKKTGMGNTTLLSSLKRLESAKLIEIERKPFIYKKGLVRHIYSVRNCYRLYPTTDNDPDLPVKEILYPDLSPQAKGLLLMIIYEANVEGYTFMTRKDLFNLFTKKPHTAFKELMNKGYIDFSPYGIRITKKEILDLIPQYLKL